MHSNNKETNKQPAENDHSVEAKSRRIESRDVDSLHAHPRQAEFFGDLAEHELAALTEDVRRHGMNKPPEILPDGTIIRGHQRVRAARLSGWEKIDVIVRSDLEGADEDTILEAFVDDNLHRRHLSKLQQAKAAMKLGEIDCDRQHETLAWQQKPLIVKRVAQRLHCSPKSAQRYISVARAPVPIQQALERDLVTLVDAAKVANLPDEAREELAASVTKLLKQAAGKGTGTAAIKKKICDLVQTAFQKNRKQKRVSAPSPTDTLYAVKKFLQGQVAEIRERKGLIISQLRGDDLSSGLRASVEFSIMLPIQQQIVHDVRARCHLALEVVDEIAIAIKSEEETSGGSAAGGSNTSIESD